MTPCPCARAWLSEMVEEALRRKPADADASWVVDWLLKRATDLTIARQDAIMKELENRK